MDFDLLSGELHMYGEYMASIGVITKNENEGNVCAFEENPAVQHA